MRSCGNWKHRLGVVIAASGVGMLLLSCQTQTSSNQTREMSADVRLVARIGRATSRYRNSQDLAGYAQSAVERSLAERHWQINREILKLEFARVKLDIEEMAALKDKKTGKPDKPTADVEQQNDNSAAEAKIRTDIEKARQQVARAEQRRESAKSNQEIENAQSTLIRARQVLEIATKEMELHETNLRISDLRQKESGKAHDEVTSLRDKIASLEKEALGDETADVSVLKSSDQASSAGLMGALRSWWNLYDKVQVLETAEQRAKRLSDDFKDTQAENQKKLGQLQDEHQALNRQIQLLYSQANELLNKPGQDKKIGELLEEANGKMKASAIYGQRRESVDKLRDIFQQQLVLATEDEGRLGDWIQRAANSRARALTRLLKQLGSVLGMILAVFIIAYFVKKIPRRFVKEEKSAYYFRKLISFVAWLIVILLLIFNAAGGIGSISAVIGLAGAGLAIALQDPIVSLVGWFLVVGKYGISVGDRIEINGVKGDVVDVGMLRIAVLEVGNWLSGEQSTGRMVFFPNSFIFKGHFFNYSTTNSFIWDEVHILVTYESQWKKAHDIILKIAEETSRDVVERARENQEKLARRFHINLGSPESYAYVNIADSGVDIVLRYLSEIKLRRIMHDRICREILEAFEKHKDIQLAYPTTETRVINAGGAVR